MNLIFATNNQNKAKEIETLLPPKFSVQSLKDIGFNEDIPETADTIEGNALLKARFIFGRFGGNCFADDTGLEVEALNGEPGVYSARYAGEACDAKANMEKLLQELKGQGNRNARFKTVIALILNGREYLFEGIINGVITEEERGERGFGYDPVFMPEGYSITFAEMELQEKNLISHRGIAVRKMVEFFKAYDISWN
jgi:XTP/dITP diphosphohydrolase